MKRDFDQLRSGPFDLLVVGGGIYGAWTAYDAALRGLRVALVERNDWASATSSASSKLIHGGLRYLEQGRLGLVRKTLHERRRLAALGPHRVRPLGFLLPVHRGDRVGRTRLGLGLWFYDRLAGRDQPVPAHSVLGREELLRRADLVPDGLRGGFAFGDCVTDDARLTLEIVWGAHAAGAVTLNRVEATRLLVTHGRVGGALVEDREGGGSAEVRALATACTAGPWIGALGASCAGAQIATRLTKGVHLVLPGREQDEALVLSSNDDGRIVFLIPWYGRTLLGTTDTDYVGDARDARVEPADVTYLLERTRRALRSPRWSESDIVASFAGVRTLPATGDARPSDVTREWSLAEPAPGLLLSLGGKLTSARADAAAIVDRVLERAGWPRRRPPTADLPLPWCPPVPFEAWRTAATRAGVELGLDEETARTCAGRHGSRLGRVLQRLRREPDLARRIVADAPFCRAEIVHAVEEEMARSLEDVLRRRVPLLLLSRPTSQALADAAALVGERLGWDAARRRQETDALALGRAAPASAG